MIKDANSNVVAKKTQREITKKKKIQALRDEVRPKYEVLKRDKKGEIKTQNKDYTFLTFSAKIQVMFNLLLISAF